jgi:c-di-AMP phosphodiesterase-like protein
MKLQWQDGDKFVPFEDCFYESRNHFLDMFLNPTPVVAKENDMYLTNDEKMFIAYRKKNKKIVYFKDCVRSEEKLNKVGFLG